MQYITNDDIQTLLKERHQNQIVDGEAAFYDTAEVFALSEMKAYLRNRYDVAAGFSQTGNDRDGILVMICVDCTLFHAITRMPQKMMPEVRERRYNEAKIMLEKMADGILIPDLPRLKTTDENGAVSNKPNFRISGDTKRSWSY